MPRASPTAHVGQQRLQQIERRRLDELEGRLKEKLLADDEAAGSTATHRVPTFEKCGTLDLKRKWVLRAKNAFRALIFQQ